MGPGPTVDSIPEIAIEQERTRERGLLRRSARTAVLVFVAVASIGMAYVGFNLFSISQSWQSVDRQPFDEAALEALPAAPQGTNISERLPQIAVEALTPGTSIGTNTSTGTNASTEVGGDASGDNYKTFMVVGSDYGGKRADVLIVVIVPNDGSPPVMVSLPRDLFLPNRCTQGFTRINANLNGCGSEVSGLTLLVGAVEDFTGLQIDHFALFDFGGFEAIVDAVGGTEICVDRPVRERGVFELPAGCTVADGALTLNWVRSRKTQEQVDGRWRTMPSVSDLTRNDRQQELILSMLKKAVRFDSPRELTAFVASVGDAFTLDDQLGITDAVNLAWSLKDVSASSVIRIKIPVQNYTTAGGAQVLIPTVPFDELLAGAVK